MNAARCTSERLEDPCKTELRNTIETSDSKIATSKVIILFTFWRVFHIIYTVFKRRCLADVLLLIKFCCACDLVGILIKALSI